MALLFSCGFDFANWDDAALHDIFDIYNDGNHPQSGGPYGTGQLYIEWGKYISKNIPQRTTLRFGHWLAWSEKSSQSNDSPSWQLWSGPGKTGEKMCSFKYGDSADTGHHYEWAAVEYDNTVNWLGHTDNMDPNDGWAWYEFEIVVSATVGTMTMWKNGVQIGQATGLDTAGTYTSGGLCLSIGQSGAHSARRILIDDLVIWDNTGTVMNGTNIGAIRIVPVLPDGDGSTTDWTPQGAGANYVEVDEAKSDEDTTYNESSTFTDRDELDIPAPANLDQLLGVSVHVHASRTGAGTGTIKAGIKQSASESSSNTSLADAPGYKYCSHSTSVDPSTGSAFTAAGVGTAQAFYENVD